AATGDDHRLGRDARVDHVAAVAADLLGEADGQEPRLRGLTVQVDRQLAGVLPLGHVRRDLRARVVLDRGAQGLPLGGVPDAGGHASSSSGMATTRARSHSPTALAWGSKRVDEATPSPSSPWIRMLTPARFGSGWTSIRSSAASGRS